MNKAVCAVVLAAAWYVSVGCGGHRADSPKDSAMATDTLAGAYAGKDTAKANPAPVAAEDAPAGAKSLMRAYKGVVVGFRNDSLLFADGSSLVYDDRKKKTFTERLDRSDAEDMFAMPYDTAAWLPERLSDAGRVRCEHLFRKIYGHNRQQVEKRLVSVAWFGQKLRFTSVCGAADSLRAVARELEAMPGLRKYLTGASTFYWRKVRGANRLSAHSYAIAIDINTSYSDYWLWANPGAGELATVKYRNRIPREIVKAFERHGFIWGGRWYHFDTMHFEFRPELHLRAKFSEQGSAGEER